MQTRLGVRDFDDRERLAIGLVLGRDGKATRREIRAFVMDATVRATLNAVVLLDAVTQPRLPLETEAAP